MKILITGGCGFIGTNLSLHLKKKGFKVNTIDNLIRNGSKYNSKILKKNNIKNYYLDITDNKRLKKLPKFDLIIDCCAEASVEVSKNEIDRVFNTNLIGTFNILKKAKKDKSKVIFLSSSRVYSIKDLNKIINKKLILNRIKIKNKIDENFNTSKPKSIYGFTKLASEMLIEEFGYAFKLKYLINRFGVVSGPLQFGKQDQGFVSLWIWRHLIKQKINYIGFGGKGHQIRDVLHIKDLCNLIYLQITKMNKIFNKVFNVGGGRKSYVSLKNLTKICQNITKKKINISSKSYTSIYDIPYYISNNSKVQKTYKWEPKYTIIDIVKDTYLWLDKNKKILKKYL
tara:strand:- start:1678 stop:2700 length:1023 start_codon:yes stop_codon:yes gene_type:complete